MTRIAFFAQLGFHEPLLRPVADGIAHGSPDGPRPNVLVSRNRREVVRFQPDIVVMAALERVEYFRHHLPNACVGSMRHGIGGSKRVASRLPDRSSARRLDFMFVGEHSAVDHYAREGASPEAIWFTGYPPLDPLFQAAKAAAASTRTRARTVLYAPTWNLGLSSAPMLGADLANAIRGGDPQIRIVVKPHPVIPGWRPEWMRAWHRAAAESPNVELIEDADADIVPNLLDADVLVSDASSVALSFLALDRPIVWVTNPRATADPAFAPEDLQWRRRDMGDEVTSVADVRAAVADAFRHPERGAAARREVAAALFEGWDDGRSTERVVNRLLELAALAPDARPHVDRALARPPEPAWRIHDLRVTVRNQAVARRLVLGRLEERRLRARETAARDARKPGAAQADKSVH